MQPQGDMTPFSSVFLLLGPLLGQRQGVTTSLKAALWFPPAWDHPEHRGWGKPAKPRSRNTTQQESAGDQFLHSASLQSPEDTEARYFLS